jgi:hypothetical protein
MHVISYAGAYTQHAIPEENRGRYRNKEDSPGGRKLQRAETRNQRDMKSERRNATECVKLAGYQKMNEEVDL